MVEFRIQLWVMIATTGRSLLLDRTLAALAACEKPAGFMGLILVENGCQAAAEQALALHRLALRSHYVFEPAGNKNRALNRGMTLVDPGPGSWVVLYDDDIRIAPASLMAYAHAAEHWPEAPFLGGGCACDYVQPPKPFLKSYLPASARGWELNKTGDPITSAGAMGFNWAVRRQAVHALGGFAEDRGPGTSVCVGDETQMQRRMIESYGPGRYVAEARVWHHVPPERCDEAWLTNRAYHIGIARAMAQRESEGGDMCVPSSVRRRYVAASVKWWLTRLGGSRAMRFKAQYYRQLHRGVVDGYRLPMSTIPGEPVQLENVPAQADRCLQQTEAQISDVQIAPPRSGA